MKYLSTNRLKRDMWLMATYHNHTFLSNNIVLSRFMEKVQPKSQNNVYN